MGKDREESMVVDVFDPLPRQHYEDVRNRMNSHLEKENLHPEVRKLFIEEIRRIDDILEKL